MTTDELRSYRLWFTRLGDEDLARVIYALSRELEARDNHDAHHLAVAASRLLHRVQRRVFGSDS